MIKIKKSSFENCKKKCCLLYGENVRKGEKMKTEPDVLRTEA